MKGNMMNSPINPNITTEQANEFIESIRSTLNILKTSVVKDLYIFSRDRDAVVISFDGQWRPFLCQTRGFNDPSCRVPIYLTNEVLDIIQGALKELGRDTPGGRTFLNSKGVRCIDEGLDVEIVRWDWPLGDLVKDVLYIKTYFESEP